jgi:predicted PurR-regulated permease PerM
VVVLAVVVTFALAPLISLLRRWLNRPRAIAAAYLVWLGSLLIINAAGQVINKEVQKKEGAKIY